MHVDVTVPTKMNRPHLFHFFVPSTMESVRKKYVPPGRADAGNPGTGKALQTAAGKARRECGVQGNSTGNTPIPFQSNRHGVANPSPRRAEVKK